MSARSVGATGLALLLAGWVSGHADPVTAAAGPDERVVVEIDLDQPGASISPLIYGISGDWSIEDQLDAGVTIGSWGGNPATRYNPQLGNAWNAGADWEFRNTSYGWEVDAARSVLAENAAAGIETRFAVPILDWVARNGDENTCSFPDGDGGCRPRDGLTCDDPDAPIADPEITSVANSAASIAAWVAELREEGLLPRFIAFDNEPELWGFTHYDIHPECTTYEEVLARYLEYAAAVRAVAPEAELTGPVMCCWFDYWRIAPGPADGGEADFLRWFLRAVREHDEATGVRTLDVLDVHYYPQSPVYNDLVDDETAALRLRSTRSLWDPEYVDESWIGTPIRFIPRLKRIVEDSYPGLPIFISEWNFGADGDINGALAIADALGIFGREGVYAATYWRSPSVDGPGFDVFKLYGNYDGRGSRFVGQVVDTVSSDAGRLRAYAALDGDVLRIMLVNQDDRLRPVRVDLGDAVVGAVRSFTIRAGDAEISTTVSDDLDGLAMAPTSVSLIEITLDG